MKCPRCQAENDDRLKFCEDCGAPLARACPSCGAPARPGKKFCGECGSSLDVAPTPRFASPEVYTPKHLADKILTSKPALEGERKQVTVLFADLKGSMELIAERDPEEAGKLLDSVLEHMMEAVHRYEGTVNQVMGDGIMALFGAPLAHEDHAVRACYAALRMQQSVGRYSDEMQRSGAAPIEIRIGLNSGEVVVRSIGSDLRMDYSAVGQTTHLAARLEQIAKAGSALLTRQTLKLTEGYVLVKPLGLVPIKGLGEPIEIYELTGAGPMRTRFQAVAARGLTRFVGRDAELEQLHRALRLAAEGHGQVVAVVGEPGVGKSRLLFEFTRSHRTQGWLILESGSVSYGKATAYLPIIDLLKSYFKIQDRDEHRDIREKVTGKLLALDRSLEPFLPAFLSLLDAPTEHVQWDALDPPQRRQLTQEAIKNLLLRESQVQPLVLVFEDLHWIDSETQILLDGLVERLPAAQVLLLTNYRPEYQHTWSGKTYYSRLRLDAFATDTAHELLRVLLGGDPQLEPLKRLLIANTEGNPFFLEESVRTLVEIGALSGEVGTYRLTHALTDIRVPATVQAVLAARIDRLSSAEKRLLQTAAVIGKDVSFVLLLAVAELPEQELRRGLINLQGAEFLYEMSLFPDIEYTFKHALTHEVTYQGLLAERRRFLHTRIFEAIERLYSERLTEHTERLAHHAVHGEVWDKAVQYLRQSGIKALNRCAYGEAVRWLEAALDIAGRLPAGRPRTELMVDLRFDLRNALWPQGQPEQAAAHLLAAEADVDALGHPHRLGRLLSYLSVHFLICGDEQRAIDSGRRAVAAATRADDRALEIVARQYLGSAYFAVGDLEAARALLGQCVTMVEGEFVTERLGQLTLPSVLARAWLSWCLAEVGEFNEAQARANEALKIACTVNQPWSLVFACLGTGIVHLRRGEFGPAIATLERGLDLCRRFNIRLWLSFATAHLGYACLLCGRVAEALPLLDQAQAEEAAGGLLFGRALRTAYSSEGYFVANRTSDAIALAARALQMAQTYGERGHEAWTLRLLGDIHASHDSSRREAEECYRQSMLIAQERGMRPLVAHCHVGLGKLYRNRGNREQAREFLGNATAMYREMDMPLWLEKAESALESV